MLSLSHPRGIYEFLQKIYIRKDNYQIDNNSINNKNNNNNVNVLKYNTKTYTLTHHLQIYNIFDILSFVLKSY